MDSPLRTVLLGQLESTVARRPAEEILRDVPPEVRGVQPEGLPEGYSLWQILEHMRRSQAAYLDNCRDPDYTIPEWPDGYFPDSVAPPSGSAWDESRAGFIADLDAAKNLVSDPDIDLAGTIPHSDAPGFHSETYAKEIAAIADHNAYHLGQVVTVRRLLGAWPPENMGAQEWKSSM
jgi:uncharacterized damage-inducible protein DinB